MKPALPAEKIALLEGTFVTIIINPYVNEFLYAVLLFQNVLTISLEWEL